MMSTERKGTEVIVGLFLLIGFSFIAVMVVMFGRVGMGTKGKYVVTIDFPNASGIVKGSDVLLAGARIGTVTKPPAPPVLVGNRFHVAVELSIRDDVRIPRASNFVVGSSGLLGDRYVDVQLHPEFDPNDVIEPGSRILGVQPGGGLSELTNKGGAVMDQVGKEIEKLAEMLTRINEGVLHQDNLKNLEAMFANLKVTTDNLKTATSDLDELLKKTGGAVDAAKGTMTTAEAAAADLRLAIADIRKTADAATKAVDSTRLLMKKAADGDGAIGALINDPKLANDLRALVANMRRSGVLFYKNRPLETEVQASRGRR